MKILFLSLIHFTSLQAKNIYTDLLREFQKNGHEIYCIAPIERQNHKRTKLVEEGTSHILELRIGKTQKTNIVEKGISTLLIEPLLLKGIKKYFSDVKFDLVLYSTPPITFYKAVQYVKKRDRAVSYLLLKDIFPQNAVDLGMLKKAGVSSFIYHFFREKEKRLYKVSDFIGCMSDANVKYLMEHNKDLRNVHVLPNSIQAKSINHVDFDKEHIRCKYKIPLDKKVLIYGGNLGKPQGINFLIECVENLKDNKKVFFVICGKGTEYSTIKSAVTKHDNVLLINGLPEKDYDSLVRACDIGLIFLDKKFTIPKITL